jgi:myo-inositol-1(or 4)-monophosphatase
MALGQKDFNGMLETAVEAARLSGRHAMEELSSIRVSIKNKSELVTQADAQCQQMIINKIQKAYPDHGFIAEEGEKGKIFKQSPREANGFWWVIDPIDGTNNYAHRMLLFAVSIAVMREGEPIVGVIYEPATDSMFSAVKGGEAQLNGARITAGEGKMDEFSSVGLDSHFDEGVPGWTQEIMQRTRFRNLGTTALQLAYVAKGGLVATIVNRPKLWDIAAGALIAETAGAVVSDWYGGKAFPVDLDRYNGGEIRTIAANKKVHAELLKIIKS